MYIVQLIKYFGKFDFSLILISKLFFAGPPGATNSYQVGVNHGQGGGTSYQKVRNPRIHISIHPYTHISLLYYHISIHPLK